MNCDTCDVRARRIAELEEQVERLKGNLLRCLAEEENTRRAVIRAVKAKG